MSGHAADRNLLFGVFALQMDFLTRDQLVDGMQAWVLEKSRPLEDILVAKGFLAAADRDLLLPLIARHIEQHDGNPENSLKAISSLSPSLEVLSQIDDCDVQQSLASLTLSERKVEGVLSATVTYKRGDGQVGTRYLSIRPHAKGGLGEVFVALDTELDREVALKEIQGRHAHDADSRSRFLMEAELTGKLEHPGIVPVYGLGQYEDGRPFYAMRFIRGDSFHQAIKEFHKHPPAGNPFESVAFRKLLGRFVDVCNAVGYAHSRGVLHRDLKPGNVMLGKHGEALVVDWGLAKLKRKEESSGDGEVTLKISSGSGTDQTLPGSAIGTPGYMSPEQAEGKVNSLGPATDIYGLGATLYTLLTGKKPIDATTIHEALERTTLGDIPEPSEINSKIPKPLEAICKKAMQLSPSNRYASCESLAEDVERYLADEPVSAHPESLGTRAARIARKHRGVVTTTAAALLLITIVSLGAVFMINALLKEAERQANIAQKRLEQANEVATELLFTVDRKLKDIPGAGAVRRELLGRAEKLLESLLVEAGNDPNTLSLRAVQLLARGDVALRYEDTNAARAYYEESLAIWRKLAEGAPAAQVQRYVAIQKNLSICLDKLARIASLQGDPAKSYSLAEESLAIHRKLAEAEPTNAQAQRELDVRLFHAGVSASLLGDRAKSYSYHEEALAIRRKLAEADPTNVQAQRDLCNMLRIVGGEARSQGNLAKAQSHFEETVAIARKLADANRSNDEAQRELSLSLLHLASFVKAQGDLANAQSYYDESVSIARKLPIDSNDSSDYSLRILLGFKDQGEFAKAQSHNEESLAIARKRANADPTDVEAQRSLYWSLVGVGTHALRQGNLAKAHSCYEESYRICRKLTDDDPSNAFFQHQLAIDCSMLGQLAQYEKDWETAARRYQEGIDILDRLPVEPDYKITRENLVKRLAHVEAKISNIKPAVAEKPRPDAD